MADKVGKCGIRYPTSQSNPLLTSLWAFEIIAFGYLNSIRNPRSVSSLSLMAAISSSLFHGLADLNIAQCINHNCIQFQNAPAFTWAAAEGFLGQMDVCLRESSSREQPLRLSICITFKLLSWCKWKKYGLTKKYESSKFQQFQLFIDQAEANIQRYTI